MASPQVIDFAVTTVYNANQFKALKDAVSGAVYTDDQRLANPRQPLAHFHSMGEVAGLGSALQAFASVKALNDYLPLTGGALKGPLTASSINSGAFNLNGAPLFNPLSVYGSGSPYSVTATALGVDMGTTDPTLVLTQPGIYCLRARAKVDLVGATFIANRTVTLKLARVNNGPADLSNSSTSLTIPIVSALTQTLVSVSLPEIFYQTVGANDQVQIFAGIDVLPSVGVVNISEASIIAVRIA